MAGRSIDSNTLPWNPHRDFENVRIKTLETRASHPGISLHIMRIDIGAEMTSHTHGKEIETLYITSGRGILTMGHAQAACSEGFCASIPPGTVHALRNIGDTPLDLVAVFNPPLD